MTRRFYSISSTLLLAACAGPAARPVSPILHLSFEETVPGHELVSLHGEWEIIEVSGAADGTRVLAQVAKNPTKEFNVALVDGHHPQAVDMSVSIRSVAGEIDQGGGPLWRAQDVNNYYIARYNPLENNYRVYSVVDGERNQLQSAEIPAKPGWHELRVTMEGDLIRCYYDGLLSLEVRDSTFSQAGQVGLWTKADAQTEFDNLLVR